MGEDRTLTVAARNENIAAGDELAITSDPVGVVELLTPTVQLRAHARREDLLVGQIRIRPLIEGEVTLVAASMADRSAHALVEVRPSREVVEEPVEPPTGLQFERPSYRVGWQKRKSISIIAPASLVASNGQTLAVTSSDPGVVVRGNSVTLTYDDALDYYRASVQVEARILNATATLSARLGDTLAETVVAVVRKEEGPNFVIRLVPEEFGMWRAVIEKEPTESGEEKSVIKIAGRHTALRRYIGDRFEHQNSPICRGMIAEIVADVTARMIVSELYRIRRGTESFDADRFYREHYKRLTRFLPRFQALLVGQVTEGQQELPPAVGLIESAIEKGAAVAPES
jgi:hypothetical protein